MQALLMLYMTKYLLLPQHARDVLGLAQFRSVLSSTSGPMTDLAFATLTYGIYSGLIYASPLLGAWLGDRVIGKNDNKHDHDRDHDEDDDCGPDDCDPDQDR